MAASFLSHLSGPQDSMSRFIAPPGLDLSSVVAHGNAVLLAWAADYSPVKTVAPVLAAAESAEYAVAGGGAGPKSKVQSPKSKVQ